MTPRTARQRVATLNRVVTSISARHHPTRNTGRLVRQRRLIEPLPLPLKKSLSPFFFFPSDGVCMSGLLTIAMGLHPTRINRKKSYLYVRAPYDSAIPRQSARVLTRDPTTVPVCQGSPRLPWVCIPPASIARNHTCMSGLHMIPGIPRQSARVMTRDPATVPVCEGSSRSPWACILFASISRNHTCMSGPHMILAHQRELWRATQRPCLYVRVHNDHHGLAFHLLQSQEIIPV